VSALLQELLRVGVYKRSQGRITRQVTFAALAAGLAIGMWRLSDQLTTVDPEFYFGLNRIVFLYSLRFGLPFLLLLLGWWVSYRIVNLPAFADFLIAVEAEMNKVSWPSRGELFRASVVVLVTIIALAFLLYVYDFLWRAFFYYLRIF
jgi:preprotein translocase subunit SecE